MATRAWRLFFFSGVGACGRRVRDLERAWTLAEHRDGSATVLLRCGFVEGCAGWAPVVGRKREALVVRRVCSALARLETVVDDRVGLFCWLLAAGCLSILRFVVCWPTCGDRVESTGAR